jgi:hypothetical protein
MMPLNSATQEVKPTMSTRRKAQRQQRFLEVRQKTQMMLGDDTATFVVNNNPNESISGALTKIIEPYRQFANNKPQLEKLLLVAMVAWNTTVVPENDAKKLLKMLIGQMKMSDVEDQAFFIGLIAEFVSRKQQFYPNDKRLIVSTTVRETKGRFDIQAASTHLQD